MTTPAHDCRAEFEKWAVNLDKVFLRHKGTYLEPSDAWAAWQAAWNAKPTEPAGAMPSWAKDLGNGMWGGVPPAGDDMEGAESDSSSPGLKGEITENGHNEPTPSANQRCGMLLPSVDEEAFKAAWVMWLHNTDVEKFDRDSALHSAILAYECNRTAPVQASEQPTGTCPDCGHDITKTHFCKPVAHQPYKMEVKKGVHITKDFTVDKYEVILTPVAHQPDELGSAIEDEKPYLVVPPAMVEIAKERYGTSCDIIESKLLPTECGEAFEEWAATTDRRTGYKKGNVISHGIQREAFEAGWNAQPTKRESGAVTLLKRWMDTAKSGHWRDGTHLSIQAHPIYDATLEYVATAEKGGA